jgi:glutamate synthase (NADPH/NADH)
MDNDDDLKIKMEKGEKNGEGGELKGNKVRKEIEDKRNYVNGVGIIYKKKNKDIY